MIFAVLIYAYNEKLPSMYHTVGTVPTSNQQSLETDVKSTHLAHISTWPLTFIIPTCNTEDKGLVIISYL